MKFFRDFKPDSNSGLRIRVISGNIVQEHRIVGWILFASSTDFDSEDRWVEPAILDDDLDVISIRDLEGEVSIVRASLDPKPTPGTKW